MKGILRVGVAGCGIGKEHIRRFQQLPDQFEVRAVCDVDEDKAKAAAKEFSIPVACTGVEQLCAMEEIDLIDLCTPPFLHFDQIKAVIASGKHAFCEKPLASSIAEVDELIALEASAGGLRVMPIFQYRFGHGLQKLRYLVDLGLTGKAFLATAETAWHRGSDYYSVPWRRNWATARGGCVLGHAIHAHDVLFYILGGARNVYARTATLVNPIEVEDCASISLEMQSGALASLSVTLGSVEEISRHRFCFGNLVAESNTAPYDNTADPWKFIGATPAVQKEIDDALRLFIPKPEGFAGQFTRFYDALENGSEAPVTLADARASLELVTAVYYSAEQGLSVDLPINRDHPRYGSWLPANVRAK